MRKIHLYLSLPFGLLITLICFSGAMLVFEKEICAITHRDKFYVEQRSEGPLSLDTLKARVERTLPKGRTVTGITIFGEAGRSYQMSLSQPRKASLYVDPYTGEVLASGGRTPFFQTMFRLHRWLLGPAKNEDGSIGWGKCLVGISTLVFVAVILSGLFLWWPKKRKKLTRSLRIPIAHGLHPFLRGLHVAGGVYATLLLLAMALTGLTWSFGWYRTAFYALFGCDTKPRTEQSAPSATGKEKHPSGVKKKKGKTDFSWQSAYEVVAKECPGFKQLSLSPRSTSVSFGGGWTGVTTDKFTLNATGEKIADIERHEQRKKEQKLRSYIRSVHTGSFGGWTTRILWFVGALLGATLPLTGYYLWWKRIKRNSLRSNPTAPQA